jgi:transcriptional regulator with XRE-family HTH domain
VSDEIIKNIGKKLKQRRIDLRLTQVQLSDLIGIEDSALRRIETGRTNPTIKTLLKLTNALSIDVSYLFEK